jgi:Na+/melibiose symporter-like transporter
VQKYIALCTQLRLSEMKGNLMTQKEPDKIKGPDKIIDLSDSPLRMLSRRETQGPALIVIGCLLLFSIRSSDSTSPIFYGFAVLLGLIVLAGILMTFHQLRRAEIQVEQEPLPESSDQLEHAVTQLSKNYELLRRQSTQGFILASVFMLLGLIVILSGSVGQLFGFASTSSNLTSVAGIISEFISGTALLIYRINFKRLNETSDKLQQMWKMLTAYRLTAKLPEEQKATATMSVINALLGNK